MAAIEDSIKKNNRGFGNSGLEDKKPRKALEKEKRQEEEIGWSRRGKK